MGIKPAAAPMARPPMQRMAAKPPSSKMRKMPVQPVQMPPAMDPSDPDGSM